MWMRSLLEFIENSQDKREVQRAIAVRMLLEGYTHVTIQSILSVSSGFISKCKKAFFTSGVEGLKLRYKGSQGFLNSQQRAGVIKWLKTKDKWNLSELEYEIAFSYGVVFESKQSYYDLFDAARISWKKTQAHNPKYDEELVASKKKKSVSCSKPDVLKSSQES